MAGIVLASVWIGSGKTSLFLRQIQRPFATATLHAQQQQQHNAKGTHDELLSLYQNGRDYKRCATVPLKEQL